jgi:hypothetical protein
LIGRGRTACLSTLPTHTIGGSIIADGSPARRRISVGNPPLFASGHANPARGRLRDHCSTQHGARAGSDEAWLLQLGEVTRAPLHRSDHARLRFALRQLVKAPRFGRTHGSARSVSVRASRPRDTPRRKNVVDALRAV